MNPVLRLESARLLLRQWRDEDLAPFADLCADPQVMRYFPAPLTRLEAAALIGRIRGHFSEHGFGLWALERLDTGAFIGLTGLLRVNFEAPFAPAVEIGWRLDRRHWGQGYASEAAWTCLRCAFSQLHLDEVVSFTSVSNLPRRRSCRPSAWSRTPRAASSTRACRSGIRCVPTCSTAWTARAGNGPCTGERGLTVKTCIICRPL